MNPWKGRFRGDGYDVARVSDAREKRLRKNNRRLELLERGGFLPQRRWFTRT